MKHYFPIPDSPKELKIEANYQLGGRSFLSGQNQSRGLYVHFTPVERGDGFERTVLLEKGSFKMLTMPLARRSQKRLNELNAYVSENAEKMAELHSAGKYKELFALVKAFDPANALPKAA